MKLKDLKGFPKEKERNDWLFSRQGYENPIILDRGYNQARSEIGEMKLVWDRHRLLKLITGVGGFDGDTEHEILERIVKEFPIKAFPIKVKK